MPGIEEEITRLRETIESRAFQERVLTDAASVQRDAWPVFFAHVSHPVVLVEILWDWLRRRTRHRKNDGSLNDTIAIMLMEDVVEKQSLGSNPRNYRIPRALRAEFRTKMRLYREALALLLVLRASDADPRFYGVLKAYGKLIPTVQREKRDKLTAAVGDLTNLTSESNKGREVHWAKDWFQDIGHEEWNPVVLMLFAAYWMTNYVAWAQALKKLSQTVPRKTSC